MKKKDGFLYILRHPDRNFTEYGLSEDEYLFKIGITTRTVQLRLKQHNTDFTKAAGMVVQETGRPWEVQEVYSVQDVYATESLFWQNTWISQIPYRGGVEIWAMRPGDVQVAIEAVLKLSPGITRVDYLHSITKPF